LRRGLPGGYELDDDVARIDVDAVHRYLSEESYWAKGRSRERMERAIANSARVVGLYTEGELVGFARVVSDGVQMAYLADVYVDSRHRGRGLGVELIREAVDNGPHADLLWMLGTLDAHELYERFGFGRPDERWLTRHRPSS
jgi:GNAT superfamily N-acetyltransferase